MTGKKICQFLISIPHSISEVKFRIANVIWRGEFVQIIQFTITSGLTGIYIYIYHFFISNSKIWETKLLYRIYIQFSLVPAWMGALCLSVSFLISPLIIAISRKKSTRLAAFLGGMITTLACLFTSFAVQFHQVK